MTETLIHYSHTPLRTVKAVSPSDQSNTFKPNDLWVSVEGPDDWKSWCESASYPIGRLPHRIVLSDTAHILQLSSAQEIDNLTKAYGNQDFSNKYKLNWFAVAERYDGIIIAPYVWERRMDRDASWYYTWDCASGCIWNASAVKEIIPQYNAEIIQNDRRVHA